ncbi:MAG: spore coat associated protein CotJA [Clostridia bacterium]|nr:spore coat associated protein CotJA [Clostridia bacterium]
MRFEGTSRGISRSDYEQFSQFLGLSQPKHQRDSRGNSHGDGVQVGDNARPIGMVYAVEQKFHRLYDPEIGLENGTVFEELNLPFYPVGCKTKNKEGCL